MRSILVEILTDEFSLAAGSGRNREVNRFRYNLAQKCIDVYSAGNIHIVPNKSNSCMIIGCFVAAHAHNEESLGPVYGINMYRK
jgi:hypothetical protein